MKKKITKKLSSPSGESIAEVLIALLISVLGVLMLSGMIDASCRLIDSSTKKMQDQYAMANVSAEPAENPENGPKMTLTIGTGTQKVEADFKIVNQIHTNEKNGSVVPVVVYYTPRKG